MPQSNINTIDTFFQCLIQNLVTIQATTIITLLASSYIVVLNYPNSPTGKVATPEFYGKVVQFARDNEIVVFSHTMKVTPFRSSIWASRGTSHRYGWSLC